MSNFGICSWEQFDYIRDGLYFNLDFRYGALLGTQVHHRSVLGEMSVLFSENYEARGVSGKKYEAQIANFRILLIINRFSRISWKAESR